MRCKIRLHTGIKFRCASKGAVNHARLQQGGHDMLTRLPVEQWCCNKWHDRWNCIRRTGGGQKCEYNGYDTSVIMEKNSCSLISPSWSRSNSSIIACLDIKKKKVSMKTGTDRNARMQRYARNTFDRSHAKAPKMGKMTLTAHHPPIGLQFLLQLSADFVNWFSQCYHRQITETRDEFRPLDLERVSVRSLMARYMLGRYVTSVIPKMCNR